MKPTAARRASDRRSSPAGGAVAAGWAVPYVLLDSLRRAQADALALALGSSECGHTIIAADRLWRLREYDGASDGPPVLIVAAPIKRPYIWDLAPTVSAVRYCLVRRLRPFLLEWLPAPRGCDAGLGAYARVSLVDAVAHVTRRTGGARPFLMGHSLGGTFAAIYAASASASLRGLVLLGAPLCFRPGSGRFRDAVLSIPAASIAALDVVPGSLLTQLCACAAPDIFVWPRVADAGLTFGDPDAAAVRASVERWALDELPLPGRLVGEIFEQLYREDRFYRGVLEIGGRCLGPAALELPLLAVANTADEVAPPASVRPFVAAAPKARGRMIEHDGESGVGLQHLVILVGRKARALIWPQVVDWLRAQP